MKEFKKLAIIGIMFSILLVLIIGFSSKVQAVENMGEFYQKDGNYITGILPYTTVEDLRNNLEMDGNPNFVVKDKNGNIIDDKRYVGSGMKLELDGESYTLVVTMDYSQGDGMVDISDAQKIRTLITGITNPTEKYERNVTAATWLDVKFVIVDVKDIIAPKSFTPKIVQKANNSITISGETTDNSKGTIEYYFKIDDGEWVSNTDKTKNSYTFQGVDLEVEHTFRMKVSDASGNQKKTGKIDTNQIFAKLYIKNANDTTGTLVFTSTDRVIPEYGTVEKDYGDISNLEFKYNKEPWYYSGRKANVTEVTIADKIKPTDTSYWFQECSSLERINNIENLDTSRVTKMHKMFKNCKNLKILDVGKFDTSDVTDMGSMFSGCESLTELDVSKFDTSNTKYFNSMFNTCKSLTELDVSNFNTSNATDMNDMFSGCESLTELDVSKFDTSNVTNISGMFSLCKSLTELDLSNFNTSNVTSMIGTFHLCKNLTRLNISKFDTSNVTNMVYMFSGCEKLTELDLSNFVTSNVETMEHMFLECKNLTRLNISSFDTSNVTNMYQMFEYCEKLTKLDVSSFNTRKVTNMSRMFGRCGSLTDLDLRNFDTNNVTDMSNMFLSCTNLGKILVSYNKWKEPAKNDMFFLCKVNQVTYESLQSNMFNSMKEYFNLEQAA